MSFLLVVSGALFAHVSLLAVFSQLRDLYA